jgi:photosystem II stability/assembly factor-like uncharacterized protein
MLLATADGGATWTARTQSSSATMQAVSCWSTTACVAVGFTLAAIGANSTVAYTTDGGSTWASPTSGVPPGGLHGVSCPSTNVCFAAGEDGAFRSTDGGATWSNQSSLNRLEAISCGSATACITVGQLGAIFSTGDGGTTWIARSSGATNILTSVSCPTASVCFASGPFDVLLTSTDGGTDWSYQFIGTYFWGISCTTSTSCHGVGDSRQILTTSTGGGGGWKVQRPTGNTHDLLGISCPGTSTCYAVGNAGSILVTTNGTTWIDHSIATTVKLFGISCPNVSKCYAVGRPGAIYVTTNGGTTWSSQPNPESGSASVFLTGVNCASPTACVAVGSGGTILATSDGTTWTLRASGLTSNLNGVSCASSSTCVAVGDNRAALRTSDGGSTWTAGNTVNDGNALAGVSCPSASTCYAAGYQGSVWLTLDGGVTWTAQASGTTASLNGISCFSTSACLAAGENGTIAVTEDGSIWAAGSVPASTSSLLADAYPDFGHAWVAGTDGTIMFNPSVIRTCTNSASGAPIVTGVSPHGGSVAGGTSVSISGCFFRGATSVKFGAMAAASFSIVSDTQITATTPRQAAGGVDITVTTPLGTNATVTADHFVFVEAATWCATYDLSRVPSTWIQGVPQTFSVDVFNCGIATWVHTGFNEVDLDMHFASSPGGSANTAHWLTSLALPPPAGDVVSGAGATITFTITPNFYGHEYLEALMLVEHSFWFDEATTSPTQWADTPLLLVSKAVWCASFNLTVVPLNWYKGYGQVVTVLETNCGNVSWVEGGSDPVDLDMHFTSVPGGSAQQAYWLTSLAEHGSGTVAPGSTIRLQFKVTPNFYGHVYLEFLELKEHQFWFDQVTSSPQQFASVCVLVNQFNP